MFTTEPISSGVAVVTSMGFEESVDVCVVGGGRAGRAAACAVRTAGRSVVVVDAKSRTDLGGRASALGCSLRQGLTVFGLSHDSDRWQVCGEFAEWASAPATTCRIRARRVVIATGSIPRPVALPGWTLPGVVVGGDTPLQRGQRVVVAGIGPWLLRAVDRVQASGAELVAVVDAASRKGAERAIRAASRRPGRREAKRLSCASASERIRHDSVVVGVGGCGRVESVRVGALDTGRGLDPAVTESIAADAVVLAWGRMPAVECVRLVDGVLGWSPERGGHVPLRDSGMRCELTTGLDGLYVAGDAAGVGSALCARVGGQLAGLEAAASLGAAVAAGRLAALRRDFHAARAAADAWQRPFAVDHWPVLRELAEGSTVACPCERVRIDAVDQALVEFGPELRAIKLVTRAGMGECQGRRCSPVLTDRIRTRVCASADAVPVGPSVQLPLRPVSVASLIASLPTADDERMAP